ncbi:adenosylmethionine--8-amino-7-oxononanoate transaminase [Marinilabiliaceae bacterium ANBcel2]|nr:adenosylmethionine--8-amino-7-oxononanoate transaminase [Marinilabiliaceae bacterium ANBcel2]
METNSILSFDQKHIWHPYSSALSSSPNILVERAEGVYLYLENGKILIDGMSSWWAAIHGYNHPCLNEAITTQLERMSHVMFGGLTHRPAVTLAKELLSIVPRGLEHVFYSDSGSVAVEVAMKMALQYWYSKGMDFKKQFATIKNGYHGDTWHAMSVCDPVTGMHHIFNNKLNIQHFTPSPRCSFYDDNFELDEEQLVLFFRENHKQLAAFILEPIVQGAGGMRFYHPGYLNLVKQLCDKYGVLLIIDEIATGFGRTGKMFASDFSNVSPDIMCVGKAITGGYLSFAATFCTGKIAHTISNGDPGVFMHGPTFMGNPLACSVALASVRLLQKCKYDISAIANQLEEVLGTLRDNDAVADVRILGAIGVVEMKESVDMAVIQKECLKQGVWLRPFGRLIYTMPPFIISKEELRKLTQGICNVINSVYC